MPVGAAIGGAVIGAGGSIIAGSEASSAQKHAANTAADTSLQVANENNQLFRDTRAQNLQIAAPFYNNGLAASNALTGLLLGPTATAAPAAPTGALSGYQTAPVAGVTPLGSSSALDGYSGPSLATIMTMPKSTGQGAINNYLSYYRAHPESDPGFATTAQFHGDPFVDENAADSVLAGRNAYLSSNPASTLPATTVPAAVPAAATPAATSTGSALSPFDQFRNSTNYQWRYNQGLNATRGQYAAKGALDSGAAEKSAITFGQNLASNELANYMNLLAGQQQVGLSAGNAVMGVTTGAANAIAGQNTNAGNVAANAALTSGQANANMWGTIGNTAGQVGGALFQYGLGQLQAPKVPTAQSINVTPNGSANYFAASPSWSNFG